MKKKRTTYSNFHAELTCEFDPSFLESQFKLDFEKVLENVGMPKSIKRDKLIASWADHAAQLFNIMLSAHLNFALNSCVWLTVAQVLQADISPDKPRNFSNAVEVYLAEHLKELRRLLGRRKGAPRNPLGDFPFLETLADEMRKQMEANPSKNPRLETIAAVIDRDPRWIRKVLQRNGYNKWKEFRDKVKA